MQWLKTSREIGAQARKEGKPKSANPYDPKRQPYNYRNWNSGWGTE